MKNSRQSWATSMGQSPPKRNAWDACSRIHPESFTVIAAPAKSGIVSSQKDTIPATNAKNGPALKSKIFRWQPVGA
jgi:hypothetical protein